ncbi:hypothetical protein ACQCSX_04380 [Pseudarthrobacter sp. P1]|uniref:hypothetical protein n=1 Tax=Pseudarthrobacter sp. P1 TaxID=3418418 RepID=UPI003CEC6190
MITEGTTSLTDWYIDITFRTTNTTTKETGFDVSEALKDYFPSVSIGSAGGSISLTIPAKNAIEAVAKLPAVLARAESTLGEMEVTAVEARSEAEFDKWLAKPAIPDLVGLKEIAEILHVSPQRANVLVKQDGFPAPVLSLAAGQFRTRASVESWASKWERKPGRRPGAIATATP